MVARISCPIGRKAAPQRWFWLAILLSCGDARGAIASLPPDQDVLPQGSVARLGSQSFVHGDRLEYLSFAAGGAKLFAVSTNEAILWDIASRKKEQVFVADSPIIRAASSRDGRTVALSDNGGQFHVIDIANGNRELTLKIGYQRSDAVAISPDGLNVASGNGREAVLWSVKKGKEVRRWRRRGQTIRVLQFSPDGKRLAIDASQGDEGEVSIHDVEGGDKSVRIEGGSGFRPWLRFSPDGKVLAGSCEIPMRGGHASSLRFWDARTGRVLREVGGSFDDGAFSADGRWFAVSGFGVAIYDAATGKEIRRLAVGHDHIWAIAFSPDRKILAVGHDRQIRLWSTSTWEEIGPSNGHLEPILTVAFSPDGRTIATAGMDGTVIQWGWPGGLERKRIRLLPSGVERLVYSPDGHTMAASAWYKQGFVLFDALTGARLPGFEENRTGYGPTFFNGGKELLTGQGDGSVCVWDIPSGKSKRCVGKHKGGIRSVQPTSDGRKAWWAGEYQGLGLRDLASGEDMRLFAGSSHHSEANLAVSPDDSWLTVGGRVWQTRTGEIIGSPGQGTDAISPDGRLLATAGSIWEVLTRTVIHKFDVPRGSGKALAFSPDGTVLATSAYNDVLLWDMTGRLRDGRLPPLRLLRSEMERLWEALGSEDAWGAHEAAWTFAAGGDAAAAFLGTRLHSAATPDSAEVARLRRRFADPDYDARDLAARELLDLGVELRAEDIQALRRPEPVLSAIAYLPGAGRAAPPVRLGPPPILLPLPERVRSSRAVMALEHNGKGEAVSLLEKLSSGAPASPLTKEARAALARIRKKSI